MPDTKDFVTVEKLTRFKQHCDQEYGGGGGTTKYVHHCTIQWDAVTSGSSRYYGSLSFTFEDDHAASYATTGAQLNYTGVMNFIKQHCFNNGNGVYPVSGGGGYTDSNYNNQYAQTVTAIVHNYGSWYGNGIWCYPRSSDVYERAPRWGNGLYLNFIPGLSTAFAVLYDVVKKA